MHLGTLPLSNNKIVLHTYNPLTTVSNVTQHPFKILVIISLTHSVVYYGAPLMTYGPKNK